MSPAGTPSDVRVGEYRHEALLYSGQAEFLAGTTAFIRRAVRAGDPVLVVVDRAKIEMLRRALGAKSEHVIFADMAEVGDNPGRIIASWRTFVRSHPDAAQLWGVGEPVYPERSPIALAECQLHEALLNVAFDAATPFWLLCPYDLDALTAEIIEEAHRSHPYVARREGREPCAAFRPIDPDAPFERPLPARPPGVACLSFRTAGLHELRRFVAGQARQAGLDPQSAAGVVTSVNELATNSIRHGGGEGELRTWSDGQSLVFEVSDRGHITSPLVGRIPPDLAAGAGGGLWLANQLCDLVQIRSSAEGTTIRVHRRL